jgi:hypothetical protein
MKAEVKKWKGRQEVDGAPHGAMRLVMTDHQSSC